MPPEAAASARNAATRVHCGTARLPGDQLLRDFLQDRFQRLRLFPQHFLEVLMVGMGNLAKQLAVPFFEDFLE